MHEASLIRALVGRIETLARAENAQAVLRVRVWLGALSHMSANHFREHFEQEARGTIAEGATLEAEESGDITHPDAQRIMLQSIEVEA